jgi:hypothetical protein
VAKTSRAQESLVVAEIDREVLGVDERWREEIRIVFRKRG